MPHLHTETRLTLAVLIIIIIGNGMMFIMLDKILEADLHEELRQLRAEKETEIINELKGRVESAFTVITYLNKQLPTLEAQTKAKQILTSFRFGENNYIWVHQMEPSNLNKATTLVHPAKELVGQEVTGIVDLDRAKSIYFDGQVYPKSDPHVAHIKPSNIFLLFNEVAWKYGEGVIPYYWPKVEDNQLTHISYRKLSYVKRYPVWNWVIGAGDYADQLDSIVATRALQIGESHQNLVSRIFWAVILLSFIILISVYYIMHKSNIRRRQAETALLNSERQLATITGISPVGIVRISNQGRIIWANEKAKDLLGITLTVNRRFSWKNVLHKDDYHKVKENWGRQLNTIGRFSTECRIVDKPGNITWLLAQMVWEESLKDCHRSLVLTLTNISTQKQTEKELKNTRLTLLQQEKFASIGHLASGIAHEINNPIGFVASNISTLKKYLENISAYLQLSDEVLEKNLRETDKEYLSESRNNLDIDYILQDSQELILETSNGTERIANIVGNLKEFAGIDHSSDSLSEIDINQALQSSLKLLVNQSKKNISVKTNWGDIPRTKAYVQVLNQTFGDIILNAVEAIAENNQPGEIQIKTWLFGKHICISISDNGVGIEADQIKNVFDPFFSTKEVGQGTGLGLSNAYEIIKTRHHGEISINSKFGQGTTVQIMLPMEK